MKTFDDLLSVHAAPKNIKANTVTGNYIQAVFDKERRDKECLDDENPFGGVMPYDWGAQKAFWKACDEFEEHNGRRGGCNYEFGE